MYASLTMIDFIQTAAIALAILVWLRLTTSLLMHQAVLKARDGLSMFFGIFQKVALSATLIYQMEIIVWNQHV
jgi:hypothetical protein